jgi:hypothetical protein
LASVSSIGLVANEPGISISQLDFGVEIILAG